MTAPAFGLRQEIDRLFEDTFGSSGNGQSTWMPAVDIRETQQEVRLEVEVPGMRPEEVEVTAENGVLTIRGEKRNERKEGEESSRYHLVERSYGSFMRSFQLPLGIDEEKIEAAYDNGILSIHIPKAALPQPRKIEIGKGRSQTQSGSRGGSQGREVGSMAASGTGGSSNSSSGRSRSSTEAAR
ncbi:MAG TPA: Hsp20/alpha crystallin family protein [Gemmatimonadaceae bacterium]|nr:Hsp20/alpha crystallin family protein [Gemmatimonadaceae bacterium]